MTDKSKETDPFILSNEFNEKFITHKPFEKFKPESLRLASFINYKYPRRENPTNLNIKVKGELELSLERGGGGIPPHHETWAPTDDKRQFIRVYLVPGDPACDQIRESVNSYFEYAKANKKQIMGANAKIYDINNPIKTKDTPDVVSDSDNENEKLKKKKDSKIKIPVYDYVKLRFEHVKGTDFNSPVIKTKILVRNLETRKLRRLQSPKIDDVCQYFCLGCTYKVIFCIQKLSGALTKNPGAQNRMADIILTLKQLVITPSVNKPTNVVKEFNTSAFTDDEMETDDEAVLENKKVNETNAKLAHNSESDSDAGTNLKVIKNNTDKVEGKAESKSEGKEEVKSAKPKPKPKPKVKIGVKLSSSQNKSDSDSDSNSDNDDIKQGKSDKGKVAKTTNSDSDSNVSDSDSNTKQVKQTKEKIVKKK